MKLKKKRKNVKTNDFSCALNNQVLIENAVFFTSDRLTFRPTDVTQSILRSRAPGGSS